MGNDKVFSDASFWFPDYLPPSAWHEHAPFAFWLVDALRPRTIIELGTHNGFSYFSFCQAVSRLNVSCQCFAVDTWKGDEHAGFYGESVYENVKAHNQLYFGSFSHLVRSTFDEALGYFEDGSIDLIHIDGRHFFEDVKADFENWRPKLSSRAVVLFHDTNVRERSFGVARFWDSIKSAYPHFTFLHGHGLGVLGFGSDVPIGLQLLYALDDKKASAARNAYARLGASIADAAAIKAARQESSQCTTALAQIRVELSARTQECSALKEKILLQAERQQAVQTELAGRDDMISVLEARASSDTASSLTFGVALGASLIAPAVKATQQLTERITAVEEATDSKEKSFRSLEATIRTLTSNIESQNDSIQSIMSELRKVLARAPGIETELRRLEQLSDQHASKLGGIESRTTNLQTSISALADQLTRMTLPHACPSIFRAALDRLPGLPRPQFSWRSVSWWVRTSPTSLPDRFVRSLRVLRDRREVAQSGLFDSPWYLKRNPDVLTTGADPITHYLLHGAAEGRDPSRDFDTKLYLSDNPDVQSSGTNPLLHYIRFGRHEGRNPKGASRHNSPLSSSPTQPSTETSRPLLGASTPPLQDHDAYWNSCSGTPRAGNNRNRCVLIDRPPAAPPSLVTNKRRVLLVAHSVSDQIYGAERSFIDLLRAIDRNRFEVCCVLPRSVPRYMAMVRQYADEVTVLNYRWLHGSRPPDTDVIDKFKQILQTQQIALVHVNTVTIEEPLIAARQLGIPSITHAREMVTEDQHLCEVLGSQSDDVIRRISKSADYVIGNSTAMKRVFDGRTQTVLIRNAVDVSRFDIQNAVVGHNIRVGLISSNTPKKGLSDFLELARSAAPILPGMTFHVIGPENEHIAKARQLKAAGVLPESLYFEGYFDDPLECVKKVNVVVNFSHFAESFGRTVAEAMAARRPVIVYNLGALPELVSSSEVGFVIPYPEYSKALVSLQALSTDKALLPRMGEAARRLASEAFGFERLTHDLNSFYESVLASSPSSPIVKPTASHIPTQPPPRAGQRLSVVPAIGRVTAVVPNYNYSRYLPERLQSIFAQTLPPSEILFLDDFSTDDSVEVAQALMSRQPIPYKIIRNEKNQGTYSQWLRGFSLAAEDFVWVAEADDISDPSFLEQLLPAMRNPRVSIAFCQSRRIDGDGREVAPNNLTHTDEIDTEKWLKDYTVDGLREVVDYLAYRNTIPNVSACLLRKSAIYGVESQLADFRYSGDWLLYAHMLRGGAIFYSHKSLNSFRRHANSVTRLKAAQTDRLVELARVREYICRTFPIHKSQIERLNYFLNKDYRINGLSRNSDCPQIQGDLTKAEVSAAGHLRIAFITTNNGSYNGGSEVLWQSAAVSLRRDGHDVCVLVKRWEPRPPLFDTLESAGVTLLFKEGHGFDWLVAFRPDLTVVSTGDQDEGVEYFSVLQQNSLPYVIVNQLTKEEKYWPIRPGRAAGVRAGYLSARAAFFTCKNNHTVMEARLGCRIPNWGVHYNPFHVDKEHPPSFPSISGKLNIALPAKILFLHKGQDIALEVLSQRKWRERDLMLNIYGEGPDQLRLEAMIKDLALSSVAVIPKQSDISTIWRDNHAILLASRMEGLPIMLVSAMISGRVPIATAIGGHGEVIKNGTNGFLAASPTAEALDVALEEAYQRRADWESIGLAARASILEYLPDDPVDDFVRKLYNLVCTRAHFDVQQADR